MSLIRASLIVILTGLSLVTFASVEQSPIALIFPEDCKIGPRLLVCPKSVGTITSIEGNRQVYRFSLYTQIEKKKVSNDVNRLLEKIFDFEEWGNHLADMGVDQIIEIISGPTHSEIDINGLKGIVSEMTLKHVLGFTPFISQQKIVYKPANNLNNGMDSSWFFYNDSTGTSKLINYLKGWLDIQSTAISGKKFFRIYLTVDIGTDTNFPMLDDALNENVLNFYKAILGANIK